MPQFWGHELFFQENTLPMPNIPPVIWQVVFRQEWKRTISYIYARRPISWDSDSYLSYICDVTIESLSLDSLLVVRKFPNVFQTDQPGILTNHEIEFGMDLDSDTQSILMAYYHMALTDLKDVNSQLYNPFQ